MEVLRRHSNNYGAVQRVRRLSQHLAQLTPGDEPLPAPLREGACYRPQKLSQRLNAQTVTTIVAAYQAGAITRELGLRFGLAHSSVNKLLKQQGVQLRRRGPRAADS